MVSVARCRPRLRNGTQWSRATSNDPSTTASGPRSRRSRSAGLGVSRSRRCCGRPDTEAGETDEELWLARARAAAARGRSATTRTSRARRTHGRPAARPGSVSAARARGSASAVSRPTLFCGGGWYTDHSVALACAELGYVDCTPRATRPPYLEEGAAWVELDTPARIDLGESTLAAVPTTHGAGDLARALVRPGLPPRVHAYFHDTDLVDRRRRALIVAGLTLLARRTAAVRPRRRRGVGERPRAGVGRGRAGRSRRQPGVESGSADRGTHDDPCRARVGRPLRSRPDTGRARGYPAIARLPPLARPRLRPRPPRGQRRRPRRRRRRGPRARRLPRARPSLVRLRRHDLLVAALEDGPGRLAPVPRSDHRDRLPPGRPLRARASAARARGGSSPPSSSSP